KLGLAYQKRVSRRPLEDGATIYNLALPKKGLQIEKPIKKWHRYTEETGFIQVRSNTHNWIRGYIFIFDHPYAAVTDEKGSFLIDNLPPGEYLLKAWHEGFGMKERKIRVKSGETAEVKIAFAK
ncbi:MAG: carboxypeptidase regulatory-like domain-containing protein, partial [Thermodesulfovibrionia bacterium]|nr:carboxypeptidase regulatory-like domain-containing protein [Thermodesulfovibrionia bacterium]